MTLKEVNKADFVKPKVTYFKDTLKKAPKEEI